MKISSILLFLNLIVCSTSLFARSPSVLPGVEIEPEVVLQKDFKNAKGRSFSQFKPKTLKTQIKMTTMEEENGATTFDGFIFFLALLFPGILAWIIMSKAHNIPSPSDETNVTYLNKEKRDEDDNDITKAS